MGISHPKSYYNYKGLAWTDQGKSEIFLILKGSIFKIISLEHYIFSATVISRVDSPKIRVNSKFPYIFKG